MRNSLLRRVIFCCAALLITLISNAAAVSPPSCPSDVAHLLPLPVAVETPSASGVKDGLGMWYTAYRSTLSRVRGSVCAFSPSCSHYSQEAIAQYGVVKGIIMTADRLQRCHCCINPASYPQRTEDPSGRRVYADPVADHDYWASVFAL